MTDLDTETFKTMGFCLTCERYTAHVCAKCQPATRDAEIARLTLDAQMYRNLHDDLEDKANDLVEHLTVEIAALRATLDSAGRWIQAAVVDVEPGWQGSQQNILRDIEAALKSSESGA